MKRGFSTKDSSVGPARSLQQVYLGGGSALASIGLKEKKGGVIICHVRQLQLAFLWPLRHAFALGFVVHSVRLAHPGGLFPTPAPPLSSPLTSLVCITVFTQRVAWLPGLNEVFTS